MKKKIKNVKIKTKKQNKKKKDKPVYRQSKTKEEKGKMTSQAS